MTMQSFREPAEKTDALPTISIPLAPDITVGMGTLPLLAVLLSGRLLANALTELGDSSEEVFRSDRLPPLPLL